MSNSTISYRGQTSVYLIPIFILTSLLICFGNMLTLLAIKRMEKLQTKTNAFVASLAVGDLSVGTILLFYSLYLIPSIRNIFDGEVYFCILLTSTGFLTIIVSIASLLMVSLDRWFSITYPFVHMRIVTNKVVAVAIALPWVIGLIFAECQWFIYAPKTDPPQCVITEMLPVVYYKYITPWLYFVPCGIIFVVYTNIIMIAKKQQKVIRQMNQVQTRMGQEPAKDKPGKDGGGISKSGWKATKMMMTVFGVFFICWTPRILLYTFASRELDAAVPYEIFELSLFLGLINSGTNVLVYPWHNEDFRLAFKKIFCFWRAQRTVFPNDSSVM